MRLRFSIRTLLVLTALVGLMASYFVYNRNHWAAIERIQTMHGRVVWSRKKPNWLDRKLGVYRFDSIREIDLQPIATSDLRILNGLNYLTSLNISQNRVSNLKPLVPFKDTLKTLYLDCHQGIDDEGQQLFLQFHNLEILGTCDFFDLNVLKNCHQLKSLHCWSRNFPDLSAISHLKNLEEVSFHDGLDSLESIEGWKQLKSLGIDFGEVNDLTPIASLSNLEKLNLRSNKLSDLSPLRSLPNLRSLYLADCPLVDDISCLSQMKQLTGLDLIRTQVRDFAPIRELNNLRYLHVTGLKDFSLVSDKKKLRNVAFEKSTIDKVDFLLGLPDLKYAYFYSCEMPDSELKRLQSAKPELKIYSN